MTAATRITLLTQGDCAFCDQAKTVLLRLGDQHLLEIQEIRLDSDEGRALAIQHAVLFAPGVLLNGAMFSHGRLSEKKLRRALERLPPPAPRHARTARRFAHKELAMTTNPDQPAGERARWRRYWDKHAQGYDKEMAFWDRHVFGDSREWVCSQTTGEVLEVAIGTGLNLRHYPDAVTVTGIDFSQPMLDIAAGRAAQLGRAVTLRQADAHDLPFDDDSFDTVVCTFGLCAIPDPVQAIDEMRRVLQPGGRLLLADHVASTSLAVRVLQRALEIASVPLGGEHFLRRPLDHVRAAGLEVENSQRFKLGIVERLAARNPQQA